MNQSKTARFTKGVAFLALSSLTLTGCGMPSNSGQSEAFKLGYSQAAELSSEKQDDEFTAYAYCTTIAQNIFTTDSQQEFDEYVAGCMDYVLSE